MQIPPAARICAKALFKKPSANRIWPPVLTIPSQKKAASGSFKLEITFAKSAAYLIPAPSPRY